VPVMWVSQAEDMDGGLSYPCHAHMGSSGGGRGVVTCLLRITTQSPALKPILRMSAAAINTLSGPESSDLGMNANPSFGDIRDQSCG
jgi:hypothetical protein